MADARARLGEAQEEFERTLASIKEAQLVAEDALARASEAEEKARTARREAEDERSVARREREATMADAREEARRALAEVQAEITAARELLARTTLTEARLDESAARLEERVGELAPPADGAQSGANGGAGRECHRGRDCAIQGRLAGDGR